MNLRPAILSLALAFAAGCTDQEPTGATDPASLAISDAANGGVQGFYFLPPLVRAPRWQGTFDPGRSPVVEICADLGCETIHARFTMDTGEGPARVRVDLIDQHYIVNWSMRATGATRGHVYRVRVLSKGLVLGFVDVMFQSGPGGLVRTSNGDVTGIPGSTIPVKFRIELGAGAGSALRVLPEAVTLIPGEKFTLTASGTEGQAVALAALIWSSSSDAVATVDAGGTVTAVGLGTANITASDGSHSGSAKVTIAPLPAGFSATIGKTGGSLAGPLADGSLLEITVPPDAVGSPTGFGVEPTPRIPGANASFGFIPPGLFKKPIRFTWTPPAGTLGAGLPFLYWTGSSGKHAVRLFPDGPTGRWSGSTFLVGDLPVFEPPVISTSLRALLMPHAQAPSVPASVGSTAVAQIIADGRAALNNLIAAPSMPHAEALMGAIPSVIAVDHEAGFEPDGSTLLQDWRREVCSRLASQVTHFLGLPVVAPFDFPDLFNEMHLLISWAAPAEQTRDPNLGLPFEGCEGGTPDYTGALNNRIAAFLPRMQELVNPPGRDLTIRFDEMIDSHLIHIITLDGQLEFLGVVGFRNTFHDIAAAILTELRSAAWKACRDRQDHSRIGRLIAFETVTAAELSPYEIQDLSNDMTGCTTQLEWRVRKQSNAGAGQPEQQGTLGGTGVGLLANTGSFSMREDRELVLAGLVQLLICPADIHQGVEQEENVEQLVVTARTPDHDAVIATRTVPLGGPRVYLHLDSIFVRPDVLIQQLQITDDQPIEISVDRVGNSCPAPLGVFPQEVRLATLGLTLNRVKVSLTPTTATLAPGETATFDVTVDNSDLGVTWQVTGGGQSVQGSTLTYTAGNTAGTFTVEAKSIEKPDRVATATITIADQCAAPAPLIGSRAALRVTTRAASCANIVVSSVVSSVGVGQQLQFTATVTGLSNPAVTWSATGGSINSSGLYTAGAITGVYTVTARSIEDPTVIGTAPVTVVTGTPLPTPSFRLSFFGDNNPVSPLHFTAASINLAVDSVHWSVSAGLPSENAFLTITYLGPFVINPLNKSWSIEVAYPFYWHTGLVGSATHVFSVAACPYRNGQILRDFLGNLLCIIRDNVSVH